MARINPIQQHPAHGQPRGFTMSEVVITMVIVALLCGITLITFKRRNDIEQLQIATKSLVAWLGERRTQAMASAESLGEGACIIAVDESTAQFSQPEEVLLPSQNGTMQPFSTICPASQQAATLDLRKVSNSSNLEIRVYSQDQIKAIIFSFRGTTTTEREIKLGLKGDSSLPIRCIKVMKPLGIIRMGYAPRVDVPCDYRRPYVLA